MLDPDLILPNTIAKRAESDPDRVFLQDVGGPEYSYRYLDTESNRFAAAFERIGVGPDDRVLTMSAPRTDWFCAWMGLARLGAVDVGVNTGFRGRMLDYVLTKSRCSTLLVTADHLELLTPDRIDGAGITLIVVLGDAPGTATVGRATVTPVADFLDGATTPTNPITPQVWNTSCIVLTSGTTGPSKLVMVPWGTMHTGGTGMLPPEELTSDDVWYQPLPTFHLAAKFGMNTMNLANGRIVQRETFSLSAFWEDVRTFGCTVTNMSPFSRLLSLAPPDSSDADNPLRAVVANPQPRRAQEFAKRFGFRLSASYGCSELGIPIIAGLDPVDEQTCGRIRDGWPGFEMRLVDEHDEDVPDGEIGEIVLRTREPWAITSGYFDNPEATAAAWRNGWFHIGDAMRRDADGNLYFHDRVKDCIRRRGENVSSFEIEAEINSHPAVKESGAVAVKVEGEEDEIKVFVVLEDGARLDPAELCDWLDGRVAYFMVPRYVEFIDALPKTEATQRIKKSELRALPTTDRTWDRGDRARRR